MLCVTLQITHLKLLKVRSFLSLQMFLSKQEPNSRALARIRQKFLAKCPVIQRSTIQGPFWLIFRDKKNRKLSLHSQNLCAMIHLPCVKSTHAAFVIDIWIESLEISVWNLTLKTHTILEEFKVWSKCSDFLFQELTEWLSQHLSSRVLQVNRWGSKKIEYFSLNFETTRRLKITIFVDWRLWKVSK